MLPAECLDGEDSADDGEWEKEDAICGRFLARHPSLLHVRHGLLQPSPSGVGL